MARIGQVSVTTLLVASVARAQPFSGATVPISNDKKGIGFDDLRYSPSLRRVLVPAGRTGTIVLIDPSNHRTATISGLSTEKSYGGGHGEGTTSVDEGGGTLYAIDRASKEVVIIDPAASRVTARARLGSIRIADGFSSCTMRIHQHSNDRRGDSRRRRT